MSPGGKRRWVFGDALMIGSDIADGTLVLSLGAAEVSE